MTLPVALVLLLLTLPTISLSDVDIPNHCRGSIPTLNFIKNRNSTFNEIRKKLENERVLYARAQEVRGSVLVFGAAQCRNYLSVDECVACFDVGVFELLKCTGRNSAYVMLDDCSMRYEPFNDFYTNPNVAESELGSQFSICGNQSASQSLTEYTQRVDEFLSDIRDVTPKTYNLYVASTKQVISENAAVYAVAQCAGGITPTVCQTCMSTAYKNLKNCLPHIEGKSFDLGCFAKYQQTKFFNSNETMDIKSILRGTNSTKIVTTIPTIGGVVLLFLILVWWLLYRRQKNSKKIEQDDLKGAVNYSYKDLQLATNNFGVENILGKGGFGEVFKANMDDKNVVAVKKLQMQHARAKEEFDNEVMLISNIHHRNLLRLLGWSSDGCDLLLVMEYMANGSLDCFLWGNKRGTLDWNQRYEIIFGIAKGLSHLHNESCIKIIHRDIKSSNILLTNDFKPKIADFGLARLQPEDKTHVNTKFAGTLGYAAPEYVRHGALSDKVDTYSFGIVILEIISGRMCTDLSSNRSYTGYLIEQAWNLYEKKMQIKLTDETLNLNEYEKEQVEKIIEIALLCIQSPVAKRPTMFEVVLMLQDGRSMGKRNLRRPDFMHNQDRRIDIHSSRILIGPSNVT